MKNSSTRFVSTNVTKKCTAKRISSVLSSTTLSDKRCFLLGGGYSLNKFNYHRLDKEFTIGINKTFLAYNSTMNYIMDIDFYNLVSQYGIKQGQHALHNAWLKYKGYNVLHCPKRNHSVVENTYVVDIINKKSLSLSISKGIYPGHNSGFGAMALAVALGAKLIYLLGYDLIAHETHTHWHCGYPGQTKSVLDTRFRRFKQEFEEFAPILKENNIRVVNLFQDSELECFDKEWLHNVVA